jgi:peptidyl-prolyl cis-trans isomerase C/peptidyl-prolyl cis-trans isomerase D
MKRFSILALIISAFAVFSMAPTRSLAAPAAESEVVATIGAKKITLEDFNKKYDQVRSRAFNPPTKAQFLEDLVRFEVGLQEASKRNLEKEPIVQDRIKEELYKALVETELSARVDKITVSEKEMEAYYKKNPEIRLSYILVDLKPGATAEQRAEARKRAGEIYDEVKKSKRPFEELVKLYTDDVLTKPTGGDAGWQSRVTIPPSVYDAIVDMKVGEIRGVIPVPFGFQIIKLTGRHSFENSNKKALRTAVFDEKRKDLFNELFEKLKKSYTIKTNPKLIE